MLLWGTDFHFNFLKTKGFYSPVTHFGECLMEEHPDVEGIVITGDISTGKLITKHLKEFALGFTKKIYFVLGNHCYYGGSFEGTDKRVSDIVESTPNLHWLNQGWHIHDGVAVVGVNGWYDAYYGNTNSPIDLNDFYEIRELMPGIQNRDLLLQLVRDRAGQEADRLGEMLKEVCATDTDTIIVGTHVAPYRESAWHRGQHSDDDWAPWFSSASTGAVLDKYAENYPDKTFIVLCGHSHSPGVFNRYNNMTVFTGAAQYSVPDIAGTIDVVTRKVFAKNQHKKDIEFNY